MDRNEFVEDEILDKKVFFTFFRRLSNLKVILILNKYVFLNFYKNNEMTLTQFFTTKKK